MATWLVLSVDLHSALYLRSSVGRSQVRWSFHNGLYQASRFARI